MRDITRSCGVYVGPVTWLPAHPAMCRTRFRELPACQDWATAASSPDPHDIGRAASRQPTAARAFRTWMLTSRYFRACGHLVALATMTLTASACIGQNGGAPGLTADANQPAAAGGNVAGGNGGGPSVSSNLTYYHDIKPIMDGKCANCHAQGGIAPFTLLSYGDANDHRVSIMADVSAGTMPPWMPSAGCNTYDGDFSLSATERQSVITWIQSGAPAGYPK